MVLSDGFLRTYFAIGNLKREPSQNTNSDTLKFFFRKQLLPLRRKISSFSLSGESAKFRPTMGKKRKNFQRDLQRLQTFLQTKCLICYTPEQVSSRRLPCCKIFMHKSCLLKCFQHAGTSKNKCPHCRQEIYPINKGEDEPSCIPEGVFLFRLEFETFAAKSPAQIAAERWDYLPSLMPPPGWSEY